MIVHLKCEDDSPKYDQRVRRVQVVSEGEKSWIGYPLDNPDCPMLTYPKFAWKCVGVETDATHGVFVLGDGTVDG